jgi:CHAD domain-containing protein
VRTCITPYLFTDQLHRSRKRLKEIAYGAEVSEYIRTQLNLRFSMAVVAELEDKIGDWHDLALAYETPGLSLPTRERLLIQKKEKLDAVYRLVRAL